MEPFDYRELSDEAVRTEYRHILARSKRIAGAMHGAYGSGKKEIKTGFISGKTFNSFASENDDHYLIEIDSSIPLFMLILFARLMSDKQFMPSLNSAGKTESQYSVPFIVDPIDFESRKDWSIELNAIRSFAAGVMADICSSFVICHEVGHIACGHIEGMKHYEGAGKIAEMASISGSSKRSKTHRERRQVWEYDADAVASELLSNYVAELVEDVKVNERTAEVFGTGKKSPETILAITTVALFAFFSYMRGVRYKLRFMGDHPHPIVRACYIKDMLYTACKQRWEIDIALLEDLVEEGLDNLMDCLERNDFLDDDSFSDEYISQVDEHHDHLIALRKIHGASCAKWSWIDWT